MQKIACLAFTTIQVG